ncbi:MAG: VOC family protein [Chloroflexota bacterium]
MALKVKIPNRLHHAAWVTRDQEETRRFYEELIGLPLAATWAETRNDGAGPSHEYVHTFFTLGDGGALAFFQHADQDTNPIELSSPGHLAMECDSATQHGIKERLEAAGHKPMVIDHGYCTSLYVKDPNNLSLEFTVDAADLNEINAWQAGIAHDELKRWLGGDHSPNNTIRPH